MNKSKIYAVGEVLLDIFFNEQGSVGMCAGGSMLNMSVSCAEFGCDTEFISILSGDAAGNYILKYINAHHIGVDYISVADGGKTPLALAYIDSDACPHYTFYSDSVSNGAFLKLPEFNKGDILVFGSYYALSKSMISYIRQLLIKAKEQGALIIYDPNIRLSKLVGLNWKDYFMWYLEFADIVKVSTEDLAAVYPGREVEALLNSDLFSNDRRFFVTDGANPVRVFVGADRYEFEVPKVAVVNTVGAGDAFNAGLATAFMDHATNKKERLALLNNVATLQTVVNRALSFASEVCGVECNHIKRK